MRSAEGRLRSCPVSKNKSLAQWNLGLYFSWFVFRHFDCSSLRCVNIKAASDVLVVHSSGRVKCRCGDPDAAVRKCKLELSSLNKFSQILKD